MIKKMLGGMLILMGTMLTGMSFVFSNDFFSSIMLIFRILGVMMLISGVGLILSSLKEDRELDLELASTPKSNIKDQISCPKCYYRIPKNSKVCPKCNNLISPNTNTKSTLEIISDEFICPYCGESNLTSNIRCIKCQKLLE